GKQGACYELQAAPEADELVEGVKAQLAATGVKVSGRVDPSLDGRAASASPARSRVERRAAVEPMFDTRPHFVKPAVETGCHNGPLAFASFGAWVATCANSGGSIVTSRSSPATATVS